MTSSSPADCSCKEDKDDGLLRLSYALASNNQRKENDDILAWLETATVEDLRLAYPVLLNWCRNSSLKAAKSSNDTDDNNSNSTTTTEDVAQEIVKVLEKAIEYDAEDTMDLAMNNEDENEKKELERKNGSVSALRMSLAGYLHTNHAKMRGVPAVSNLEKRTKARVAFDRAATNTLNMVNAASPSSSLSMSQYLKPEEEDEANKGWGFPQIQIDLGLGLLQTSPADVCKEFIRGKKPLLHPFTGQKVGRMQVKKVFPSKRKPVWIEYFSSSSSSSDGAEQTDGDRPLKPDVLAKQGDDLRNDASVTCVSKLCQNIWAVAPIEWTLGVPPTVCAYDVLVTAPDAGYLEMVPGKNFLELSQRISTTPPTDGRKPSNGSIFSELSNRSSAPRKTKTGWEDVDVRKLAPSLVGSYIVNFVLGVRDRHEDNMMVVGDLKDDPRMMQIDFGYILMEFPGGVHFDMPRLTMPIALVDRFNAEPGGVGGTSTLMEDLQHDMLAAYLVLRRHSSHFIPFCAHLMSSSYEYKHVEAVLRGKHVFRTDRSEGHVIKWMSQKLTTQWAHFYFRREIKQGMVSGYYKFVETMTFEDKAKEIDENQRSSGNIRGKIRNFFSQAANNTSTTTNRGGSSEGGESSSIDDDSHYSVPEYVTAELDSAQVFKKSRSRKSYVFDTSAMNQEDASSDSHQDSDDMSKLNKRVVDAMKLQKEVCSVMISQKEEHGSLVLADFDGGDAASKSI